MRNTGNHEALRRGPGCPDLEELLISTPTANVVAHTRGCAACQAEVALFHQFESAEVRPEEAGDVAYILERLAPPAKVKSPSLGDRVRDWLSSSWNPVWLGGALAAAAAVILLVNFAGRTNPAGAGPEVYRSAPASLEILTPLGDLAQAPTELRWSSVAGASSYVVSLTEVDRTVAFYKKVTESALVLPPEAVTLVLTGKTYYLSVKAEDSGGRELAAATSARLRLSPSSLVVKEKP